MKNIKCVLFPEHSVVLLAQFSASLSHSEEHGVCPVCQKQENTLKYTNFSCHGGLTPKPSFRMPLEGGKYAIGLFKVMCVISLEYS